MDYLGVGWVMGREDQIKHTADIELFCLHLFFYDTLTLVSSLIPNHVFTFIK